MIKNAGSDIFFYFLHKIESEILFYLQIIMQDIKQREEKMQEVAKNMTWRDFLKQIASRTWLGFYRVNGILTINSPKHRRNDVLSANDYLSYQEKLTSFWKEYNFDKDFNKNLLQLVQNTKMIQFITWYDNENWNYATSVFSSKNIYLSNIVINSENVFYSFSVKWNCYNVYNSVVVRDNSENIYTSLNVVKSMNIFYSKFIENSSNIWFSSNLIWCHECIWCNWLKNKSYCIQNKQYNKEIYLQMKKKILLQKGKFLERYKKIPNKWSFKNSINVSWSAISNSENITNWYFVYNTVNWKNIIMTWWENWNKNMFNVVNAWSPANNDFYNIMWAWLVSSNLYNSSHVAKSMNIYYSYFLENCSYCFWCVWLKNKQFCILNKQYSKEERFEKVNKIFEQMEKDWQLWKFFPANMNPFYFNDTVAYLIDDSFTKEEVTKEWFLRREEEIKVDIPEWVEIVKTTELNKYQWYNEKWERRIDPEIMKKVIIDEKWNAYRIVKMEYEFLMKQWLPLPQIHWLERIKLWLKFK